MEAEVDRETVRGDEDDERRLEHVYREHADRLWRAVFLASGDRDVADDAVAEAFAQALRGAGGGVSGLGGPARGRPPGAGRGAPRGGGGGAGGAPPPHGYGAPRSGSRRVS